MDGLSSLLVSWINLIAIHKNIDYFRDISSLKDFCFILKEIFKLSVTLVLAISTIFYL